MLSSTAGLTFSNLISVSRLSGHHRPATADAVMSSSFHGSMTSSHHEAHNNSSQLLEMTKSLIENFTNDNIMTQSLDPGILAGSNMNISMTSSMLDPSPPVINNGNLYNDQSSIPILQSTGPLQTASKMMPVPESLMSPDCGPPMIMQQRPVSTLTSSTTTNHGSSTGRSMRYSQQQRTTSSTVSSKTSSSRTLKKPEKSSPSNSPRKAIANTTNTKIYQNQSILKQTTSHQSQQPPPKENHTAISSVTTTEDEEEDEVHVEKLKSIRKAAQKTQKQLDNHQQLQKTAENKEVEKSAILIQKLWRGYSTRKKTVHDIAESLQQKRTQDYVLKLTKDMEMTKQALENERKIQQLQM